MGCRAGKLWPGVTSFGSLLVAYRAAARGKRGRLVLARFEFRWAEHLLLLQRRLVASASMSCQSPTGWKGR